MKIQDFLKHHGISRNPFAEEDAQTDVVFKNHCIDSTFHVGWDKVCGDPDDPATSIVFGEKGAGKTALKLQIEENLGAHNRKNPNKKVFVIPYDDFNPFLDRFRDHFGGRFRRADKLLGAWRLWDHMDAILTNGVTKLVDECLVVGEGAVTKAQLRKMPRNLRRDLLLLTTCYDQSKSDSMPSRWKQLRRRLGFGTWKAQFPFYCAIKGTIFTALAFLWMQLDHRELLPTSITDKFRMPDIPWWVFAVVLGAFWLPFLIKAVMRFATSVGIKRRYRVGKQHLNPLRKTLMNFTGKDLLGQPLPNKDRTDDRYELLGKLQNVLEYLNYHGIVVLMDRLDEPHLINGQAELMQAFLWPMLDNKFLKHPGFGIKMMLPIELRRFVDRADRDFYQRARLDKQNMIPSLQWTGSALYDLANSRIAAVADSGQSPTARAIFDEAVSDQRLVEGFQSLRVPRHLFKFLYRLLVSHCNAHTDESPSFKISAEQFESALAVYSKDLEAADAGVGV